MSAEPKCPECKGEATYSDGNQWVCPLCSHEWSQSAKAEAIEAEPEGFVVKDSNGNILIEGDTVVVIKDLPVKGAPKPIKTGAKMKNIKLRDHGDGHNISGRLEGFGDMNLKSEFVRKA